MTFNKNIIVLFFLGLSASSFAQKEWIGQLDLESYDCKERKVCYNLEIKGIGDDSWALGDQNYRFFYDADNIFIESITSLLPAGNYSEVKIQEMMEITGKGQEEFSPLDHIDDNIGFLDFNIVAYAKQFPKEAEQINNEGFTKIAQICLDVTDEMVENSGIDYSLNFYFSQPLTAGQITNQFSVVSEIDAPDHTRNTKPVGFVDVSFKGGLNSQLWKLCQDSSGELGYNDFKLFPNPYLTGQRLTYQTELSAELEHDVVIYDAASRIVKQLKNLPAGNKILRLDGTLSPGVYMVHLISAKRQMIEELIIIE